MVSVSFLILFLYSSLLLCNFFSIKPLLIDLIMKQTLLYLTSPASSQHTNIVLAITSDVRNIAVLEWLFILAFSIASLFASATTILASAATYAQLNSQLSFKHLLLRVLKSWKSPTITWFYIAIFRIGYIILAVLSIIPLAMFFTTPSGREIFVYTILIPVSVFYVYLQVAWNLCIVISVVEEKSGLEAFGKASLLLKGVRMQGFVLDLVFEVISLIVYILWEKGIKKTHYNPYWMMLMGLLLVNIILVIRLSAWMAFTVFYNRCKQSHGEEIELLKASLEYTKLSIQPVHGADIP